MQFIKPPNFLNGLTSGNRAIQLLKRKVVSYSCTHFNYYEVIILKASPLHQISLLRFSLNTAIGSATLYIYTYIKPYVCIYFVSFFTSIVLPRFSIHRHVKHCKTAYYNSNYTQEHVLSDKKGKQVKIKKNC